MQKKYSLSVMIQASFAILLIFSLAPSAHAKPLCSAVFGVEPLEKWFAAETKSKSVVNDKFSEYLPLQKHVDELRDTLTLFSDMPDVTVWASAIKLTDKVPADTQKIQYLGYNLMRLRLDVYMLDGFDTSDVFVSTKITSMTELLQKVLESANVTGVKDKIRAEVETQIEIIAAKVAPPKDRIIIESSVSEINAGMQLNSFSIVNRQTGVTFDINFLSYPDWFNPR